jgi:predicted  nucleic acid-binding Zn-ribbon protein
MNHVKVLLALQEIMSQSRMAEREKQKIPLEVADLKSLFEERETKFLAAKQEFEQLQKEKREKEREIEEEREKVERAKAKLMSIKTNKEYYAIEKRLTELSGEVEELGARYRERMVDIEARMGRFDKDISQLRAKKSDIAASLDAGLTRRFEMIFARRDGIAIVPARNQACTGCHMNISPQLFNLLRREDRIYSCPNCNRIIYIEGDVAEQAGG